MPPPSLHPGKGPKLVGVDAASVYFYRIDVRKIDACGYFYLLSQNLIAFYRISRKTFYIEVSIASKIDERQMKVALFNAIYRSTFVCNFDWNDICAF